LLCDSPIINVGALFYVRFQSIFMQTTSKVFSFIFTGLLISATFSTYWFGPWSPTLESRARKLITAGELEKGVELFLWKADNALSPSTRHEALWSAARLVALRSDSLTWSKELLTRCLDEKDFSLRAEAHAQLAAILFEDQPRQAIEQWQWAIYHGTDLEQSIQWRIRLAMALESEGDIDGAIDIWEEATNELKSARVAHMALGRIHLHDNPEMALHHFQLAQELAESDRERPAEIGSQLAKFNIDKNEDE
jgi:tetratricopeptide (TPR) repeat protein